MLIGHRFYTRHTPTIYPGVEPAQRCYYRYILRLQYPTAICVILKKSVNSYLAKANFSNFFCKWSAAFIHYIKLIIVCKRSLPTMQTFSKLN